MIRRLEGSIIESTDDSVVIDVNGVGYEVRVPLSMVSNLADSQSKVVLHTHLSLRQDGVTLYGFLRPSELRLFGHLISVTGIGPRVALAVVSAHSPESFYEAVLHEDVAALTTVSGVGNKTALRIILELRDKIGVKTNKGKLPKAAGRIRVDASPVELATQALMALGYQRVEASDAIEQILPQSESATEVEELITLALRALAKI